MIRQHLNRHLAHDQRRRWVGLLLETADELGNSQPGAAVDENAPMPRWGWGEVKGPYVGG